MAEPKLDNGFIDVTDQIQSQESSLPDGFVDVTDQIPKKKERSSAGAFVRTLTRVPENLLASAITAAQGKSGPSVANPDVGDKFVQFVNKRNRELSEEYKDTGDLIPGIISNEDVAGLGQNLSFSGVSMGASAAGALVPVPGVNIATSMAAGGATAYRMQSYQAMNDWLTKVNEESIKNFGRPITPEEEAVFKRKFDTLATESGLWEAGPEAVGNVLELALMAGKGTLPGRIASMIPKGVLGKIVKGGARAAGIVGTEEATETVTQMGQQNAEVKAGQSNEPLRQWTSPDDWLKSAGEVLPSVLLLSGFMTGGGMAYRGMKKGKDETKKTDKQTETPQSPQKTMIEQPEVEIETFKQKLLSGNLTKDEALAHRKNILKTMPEAEDAINSIIVEADTNKLFKEAQNATEKEPEGDISEHKGTGGVGETTETNSISGEVQEKVDVPINEPEDNARKVDNLNKQLSKVKGEGKAAVARRKKIQERIDALTPAETSTIETPEVKGAEIVEPAANAEVLPPEITDDQMLEAMRPGTDKFELGGLYRQKGKPKANSIIIKGIDEAGKIDGAYIHKGGLLSPAKFTKDELIPFAPDEKQVSNVKAMFGIKTQTKEPLTTGEITPIQDKFTGNQLEAPKEPWEMTREEFSDYLFSIGKSDKKDFKSRQEAVAHDKKQAKERQSLLKEIKPTPEQVDKLESDTGISINNTHKYFIVKALSEGKLVPPEVLKDYPDLQKKESATQKPDLKRVIDVYGRYHYIDTNELTTDRKILKRYNSNGERPLDDTGLHRGNIVDENDAAAVEKAKKTARLRSLENKAQKKILSPEELEEAKKLNQEITKEATPKKKTETVLKKKPKKNIMEKAPPGGWTEADKVPEKYRKKAEPKPEVKYTANADKGGRLIGKNPDGHNLYERGDGVRYFTDGRIRVTEPVTMAMTRGGVQPEINPDNRRDQWKTEEEIGRTEEPATVVKKEEDLSTKSTGDLVKDMFDIINEHIGERGSISTKELDETLYQKLKPYLAEIVNRAKAKALDVRAYLFGAVDSMPEGKAKKVYEAAARKYADELDDEHYERLAAKVPEWVKPNTDFVLTSGLTAYVESINGDQITWRTGRDRHTDSIEKFLRFAETPKAKTETIDKNTKKDYNITKEGEKNEHPANGSTGTGTLESDESGSLSADGRGQGTRRGERSGGETDNEGNADLDAGGLDGSGSVAGQSSPVHLQDSGTDSEVLPSGPSAVEEPASEPRTIQLSGVNPGNYRITEEDDIGSGTRGQKIDRNIAAIRLIKKLDQEHRYPTKEEQAVLAKYVGWGGIKNVFDETSNKPQDQRAYSDLKELLTKEEFFEARQSVLNAHYTSPQVIRSIYKIMRHFGFTGGNIIEPTYGSGNFIGLMPEDMAASSKWYGSELDPITAKIGQYLYPESQLIHSGFQTAEFPYGKFDAAVGNPPFGDVRISDTRKDRAEISRMKIHNYVISKTGMHLKPGGVMGMVITTRFLDTADPEAREFLAKQFKLLAAIRLPNDAFAKNAGTEVTTDLVFFQRLMPGEEPNLSAKWLTTGATMTNKGGEEITLNKYFAKNQDLMLGEPSMKGTMYGGAWKEGGKGEFTLNKREGEDIESLIDNLLENSILAEFKDVAKSNNDKLDAAALSLVPNKEDVAVGGFFMDKDRIYMREDNDEYGNPTYARLSPKTKWTEKQLLGETRYMRIKGMLEIRAKAYELVNAERFDLSNIEQLRKQLNFLYDNFVKQHGFINESSNFSLMSDDVKIEFGLEIDFKKEITKAKAKTLGIKPSPASAVKSTILNERMFYPEKEILYAKDSADGYNISLSQKGKLDIDYIAKLTGTPKESVIADLAKDGLIYQDPDTKEWIQEDEYLSGNVKGKYKKVEGKEGFEKNAKALKAVFPADVPTESIFANPGATWIPEKVYEQFGHFIGVTNPSVSIYRNNGHFVMRSSGEKQNDINVAWQNKYYALSDIFSAVANNKVLIAWDGTGDERIQNKEQTAELATIVKNVRSTFFDWIFADDTRAKELNKIYNDTQNTHAKRKNDGKLLHTVGASPAVILRNTQRDAAWRIIQSKRVLLDHCVGAGKTYTIITGVQERVRMGLTRKAMIAVPNHLVGQWAADYVRLYPGARILAATKKDFSKPNRRRLFARIATGKYDAVIVGHSSFGFIPLEPEAITNLMMEEIAQLEQAEAQAKADGNKRLVKTLANRIAKKREKITELLGRPKDNVTTFEGMGIDHLVVDESHEFKNLEYSSAMQNITGMGNPMGSKRAFDMYAKIRWLTAQKDYALNFATGTPISNSLVEMYALLRYMNRDALYARGIDAFDSWANTYASIEPRIEYTASQKLKQRTVMATFNNLPELLQLYEEFADIVTMPDLKRIYAEQIRERNARTGGNESEEFPIPKVKDGGRVLDVAEPSQEQIEYVDYLVARAERLEELGRKNDPKIDNHLWIMSDARKMALDVRLVDPTAKENPNNKINRATKKIKDIYDRTAKDRGAQLVFCDLSTPAGTAQKNAAVFIREALNKAHLENDARTKAILDSLSTYQEKWGYLRNRLEAEIEAITDHSQAETDQYMKRREEIEEYLEKVTDDVTADLTTADTGFSVYDEMKSKLIMMGIPEGEIKFIHSANTEQQKEDLFAMVNSGQVRVLLGSSQKMGAGMNVQERLVALHHMDAPWRPSDVEQREGRLVRQGNKLYYIDPTGFKVEIIAYSTANTFDAVMWQILARKGGMLDDFRSGRRSVEEVNTDSASYSEFMAETTGNPAFKEKFQLENDIQTLEAIKNRTATRLRSSQQSLDYNKDARIEAQKEIEKRDKVIDDLRGQSTFTFEGKKYKDNAKALVEKEADEIAAYNALVNKKYNTEIDAATAEAFKKEGLTPPERPSQSDYHSGKMSVNEYNAAQVEYSKFWGDEKNTKIVADAIKGIKKPTNKHFHSSKLAKSDKSGVIAAGLKIVEEINALDEGESFTYQLGNTEIEIKKLESGWTDKKAENPVQLWDYVITADGMFLRRLDHDKSFDERDIWNLLNVEYVSNKMAEHRDFAANYIARMDQSDEISRHTLKSLQFKDEEKLQKMKTRYREVLTEVQKAEEEIGARRASTGNKYISKDRPRFPDGVWVSKKHRNETVESPEVDIDEDIETIKAKRDAIKHDLFDEEGNDPNEVAQQLFNKGYERLTDSETVQVQDTIAFKYAEFARYEAILSQEDEAHIENAQDKLDMAQDIWNEWHEGEAYPQEIKLAQKVINSIRSGQGRLFNGQQYAVRETGTFQLPTLSEVQDVFKGQEVTQTSDGKIWIKTAGGKYLTILNVDHIEPDKITMNIGYSRSSLKPTEKIAGAYLKVGNEGQIRLVRGQADKQTLYHESVHFMEDLGILRPLDVAALRGHIKRLVREGKFQTQNKDDIGGSEDRANFIADALTSPPVGPIRRIINRIQDFIDKLVNLFSRTTRGVIRDIKSGEIYNEKPTISGALRDIYDEPGVETGRYNVNPPIADTFFSQLSKVVEVKLPNAGTPEQFRNMITAWANKGEFKTDELKWSGLNEWLDGQTGKISKKDVVDYLAQNQVQIQEITKNGQDILAEKIRIEAAFQSVGWEIGREMGGDIEVTDRNGELVEPETVREEAPELYDMGIRYSEINDGEAIEDVKFSSYQLPGGENYRELLLTLPGKVEIPEGWEAEKNEDGTWDVFDEEGNPMQVDQEAKTERDAILAVAGNRDKLGDAYKSPHWEEPNVLAHIRMNDRVDAEGNKVLFLEEVQSDWHQEGRKKGYGIDTSKWKATINPSFQGEWAVVNEHLDRIGYAPLSAAKTSQEAIQYVAKNQVTGIPTAPFSKTWPELVMKRMLRYAAENGYDKLAWTTGEQQAERYDLSREVFLINYSKEKNAPDDIRHVEVVTKNHGEPSFDVDITTGNIKSEGMFQGKQLDEVVGKEIAQKIMESDGKFTKLSGLDLKVGGEGMKGFYDSIIPSFLNKYAKKWGAKVGEIKIETVPRNDQEAAWIIDAENVAADENEEQEVVVRDSRTMEGVHEPFNSLREAEEWYDKNNPSKDETIVHSLDITPTMKRDVLYQGQPMYALRNQTDPPVSNDPKVLNLYLKDETDAIVQTIVNKLKPKNMTWLETMLKSPEWFDHPQIGNIVKLFMRDRNEIYHETFNDLNMTDDVDSPESTVTEAAKALKNKGLSLTERMTGKVSKEYQRLQDIIDEGDTSWKRNLKEPLEKQIADFEAHIRKEGATDDTIRVWKLYRESYDKALDLQTRQLRNMIAEIIEEAHFKGETPDLSEMKQSLKGALAMMEEWRGFYAPRLREMGNWKVQAYKEHGPMKENREWYREHRNSELAAQRLSKKLEREGWKIFNVGEIERIPETIYQDVNAMATAKLIDTALEKLSKKSELKNNMTAQFNEEILREVSNAIKARGYRSTMIHRGRGVIRGFVEDPIQRHLQYINNLSGGISKARTARMAMQELLGDKVMGQQIGGIDPVKDPKAFAVAQDYIQEQLRNADSSDRIIGLAKSIATFKFLGFNLRSLAVNMTAIMTTAPSAIHQYAMGGNGSMARVMNELARAGKDYGMVMAGRKLHNADEQAFIDDVHKKGWDDAQYTREALGELSKTHSRIWSSMMDGSMWMFGKSEKWNRGTTILAAYRLARKKGMGHVEAAEAAKTSSDKAHGVYGKSTMPMWAQGTNPAAKIGQMAYVYSKFGHNYLQMLYDLGIKKHNIKALMFAFLSPLILAGAAALPFKDVLFAFAGVILRSLFGEDKDPEKWVWDIIREHLGADAEKIGRHGLTGAAGIDISGSLSIGIGIPKNFIDLTGAIGGVFTEGKEAIENMGRGDFGKAAEHLLPSGASNIVRAFRENKEGVTTRNNRRVWNEEGKPFVPDIGASVTRGLGFRSTDQAILSERTWEGHREQATMAEKRSAIYERYRAWMIGGRKNNDEYKSIIRDAREFNAAAKDMRGVPRITSDSLRSQRRQLSHPSKNERAILRD
ncbi:MAG: hypothetical protein CVU62_13915 [Deltaproteobacteria bacterium HGW-Deltaproteobacteria-2]|jgi:N12 class adenine-specific DNA methylase|nr:MAG: hypothetical protein CVU62_13915 [Deltaproteobacteria bacterium HGW-Deltaproteobacteria-2]